MIEIRSIRQVRPGGHDIAWAIVRSMRNKAEGLVQVADLSPSTDLFSAYRRMVKAGTWGKASFEQVYVPTFVRELKHNRNAQKLLAYLFEQDRLGKKIVLACFFPDEELYHRSIVAGVLQGAGCNVRAAHDYTRYWEMYNNVIICGLSSAFVRLLDIYRRCCDFHRYCDSWEVIF